MNAERARLIAELLVHNAGVAPLIARHVATFTLELEAQSDPVQEAIVEANAWRAHHAETGETITLDVAIELYRRVVPLCNVADLRGSQQDNEQRNLLIVMMLKNLDGLGLAATSHAESRSTGEQLPLSVRRERFPSLALAMHIATGIGESVIAAAWKRRRKR